jgi:hypothetical protein
VDVVRPAYNFEPKYSVIVFARDEWTRRPGTLPTVKVIVWYTDGSRTRGKPGPESMGNLREEHLVSLKENMLQLSRPIYVLSGPVNMKFIRTLDQRNMLVFALAVRRL